MCANCNLISWYKPRAWGEEAKNRQKLNSSPKDCHAVVCLLLPFLPSQSSLSIQMTVPCNAVWFLLSAYTQCNGSGFASEDNFNIFIFMQFSPSMCSRRVQYSDPKWAMVLQIQAWHPCSVCQQLLKGATLFSTFLKNIDLNFGAMKYAGQKLHQLT